MGNYCCLVCCGEGKNLFNSARDRDLPDMRRLLRNVGVDPNHKYCQDEWGRTPLYIACAYGRINCVKLLLEHNANVDKPDDRGWNPLHMACRGGHYECAEELLKKGASVNQGRQSDGWTALHEACHRNKVGCVRLLLEHGAAVDQATVDGRTALHVACQEGHVDCGHVLLEHGAAVDAETNVGWTPLHRACRKNQRACVLLLLDHGADPAKKDSYGDGKTPAYWAGEFGTPDRQLADALDLATRDKAAAVIQLRRIAE